MTRSLAAPARTSLKGSTPRGVSHPLMAKRADPTPDEGAEVGGERYGWGKSWFPAVRAVALPLQFPGGKIDKVREKRMELLSAKRFFRPDEVARLLVLSRRTVYRMIKDGRLAAVRWGSGPWRIPREALRALLPPEVQES